MLKLTIEIDGARFDNLEGFWSEISTHVIPEAKWGHNLDAFNDILRGGFGRLSSRYFRDARDSGAMEEQTLSVLSC